MALTFNHMDVMYDQDRMRNVSQGIIFTTMSVGIGDLTDKTVKEFITRLRVVEKLRGITPISTEDIVAHIGLSTNVAYETRGQWMKRWLGYEMDDIYRKVREECDTLLASSPS